MINYLMKLQNQYLKEMKLEILKIGLKQIELEIYLFLKDIKFKILKKELLLRKDRLMKLLEEKDKEKYKKFLESHERCNFQQSLEWGEVKDSWIKEVILSEDEKCNIRGSLCV